MKDLLGTIEKGVDKQRKTRREIFANWGEMLPALRPEGKGQSPAEDTAGQGQPYIEGAREKSPCFTVRKFKAGVLEKGSMRHGGEGREAAQQKHRAEHLCVKARHKMVCPVTPCQ